MLNKIDRSYQDEIVNVLGMMKAERGNFSTLVVIPTGGGKTVIGLKYVKEHVINKGDKVLWLTHRRQLLTQTRDSMHQHDFLGFKELDNFQCQIVGGKDNDAVKVKDIDRHTDMLLATVESLAGISTEMNSDRYIAFKEWLRGINENNQRLHIIYDEAHHIGGAYVRSLFKMLLCPELKEDSAYNVDKYALIGMTATVYRKDESQIAEFYAWFKDGYEDGKLVHNDSKLSDYGKPDDEGLVGFDNRIEIIDIERLVDLGVLVKPDFIRIDDFPDSDIKDIDAQAEYLAKKFSNFSYDKWGKTMLFVENVNLAEKVGEKLPNSIVYTAQDSSDKIRTDKYLKEIRNKFEDLKSGIDIMITVALVSEGYDFKDLQTVYLYSPTNSNIRLRQRIGRVLRRSDSIEDNKSTKVIWQCDPEDQKLLGISMKNMSISEPVEINHIEDELEMKREIEVTRAGKTKHLLAPSYILPLRRKNVSYKDTEIYYELLDVMSLFDSTAWINYKGYYQLSDYKIRVDEKLMEGFEQFYRQIRTDCLSADKIFSSVNAYVTYLYGSADENSLKRFYSDVKKVSFYKSDVKSSDKDAKTRKKVRFPILDEDIKRFFKWVVENDICMPTLYEDGAKELNVGLLYLVETEEQINKKSCSGISKELAQDIVKSLDHEGISDLVEAISYLRKRLSISGVSSERKKTSDLLRAYGKGGYDYSIAEELMSLRNLISMGITSKERFQYPCAIDGESADLAFMYLEKDKFVKGLQLKGKLRNAAGFTYDNLQIARCLIQSIHHLSVSEADVDDYGKRLIEALEKKDIKFEDTTEKDKVVGEFLMALGYEGNMECSVKIIHTQCQLFNGNVPNIIKYVIYDKLYDELSREVSYSGCGFSKCQNIDKLQTKFKERLNDYGVCSLAPFKPVEDVIYDYRPYLKAILHYQGIKPEFLCRMVNFLVQQVDGVRTYVDAFGGSGASTVNFFTSGEQEITKVYNDFGVMNAAFYKVLQNSVKLEQLKEMTSDFLAIVKGRQEDFTFMESYKTYVEARGKHNDKLAKKANRLVKNVLKKSAKEIARTYSDENSKYCDDINKKREEEKTPLESTKERREEILREYYFKFKNCSFIKDNGESEEAFVQHYLDVEDVLYGIRNKCDKIYHLINADNAKNVCLGDVELAFVFFIYNSFSDRQSFDDCYIGNFGKFCGEYERWLDIGHECIQGVQIHRGDANVLIGGKADPIEEKGADVPYDSKNTVWYCDIPYSETDASDYVNEFFDVSKFIKALDNLKGYYIVSSRYNVCCQKDFKKLFWGMGTVQEEGESISIDIIDRDKDKFLLKRANILAFYKQFYDDRSYLDDIINSIEANVEQSSLKRLQEAAKVYITDEHNKARYVLIPFTRAEEKVKDDIKNKMQGNSLYKNNVVLDGKSFERMMQNTIYSNIPVEVMITNIDIKEEVLSERKIGEGIWAIPTFNTGNDASNYYVEPIVMVVRYDRFLELQYQCLFAEQYLKEKQDKDRKDSVAFFNLFLSNKNS